MFLYGLACFNDKRMERHRRAQRKRIEDALAEAQKMYDEARRQYEEKLAEEAAANPDDQNISKIKPPAKMPTRWQRIKKFGLVRSFVVFVYTGKI